MDKEITAAVKAALANVVSKYYTGTVAYYETRCPNPMRQAMERLDQALLSKDRRRILSTLRWWEATMIDLCIEAETDRQMLANGWDVPPLDARETEKRMGGP